MFPLHDDNPTRQTPWATYGVMALTIGVFLWQLALGSQARSIMVTLGFIPAVFFGHADLPAELDLIPPALTLVTSVFLHGGILHLAGNLLYLWVFANNVEEALGPVRFVAFYLICGAVAALGQGGIEPHATIPLVGASGAISGVLGAYLLLYPFARILVVIPLGFILYPARLSAYWVLGTWFLLQFLAGLMTPAGQPGIAWWAHFAGFLAGMALIAVMKRRGVRLFDTIGTITKGPWGPSPRQPDKDRTRPLF